MIANKLKLDKNGVLAITKEGDVIVDEDNFRSLFNGQRLVVYVRGGE